MKYMKFWVILLLVVCASAVATAAMVLTITALSPKFTGQLVSETAVVHDWQTLVAAGGVATQDDATVTNPTTECVATTTKIVRLDTPVGYFVSVRLGYDDGLSSITDPAGKLFGRVGNSGKWMLLPNRAGAIQATLVTETTDVADGTLLYSTPDDEDHVWERCGCDQFIWATETALAGTGSTANAVVQIKVR